MLQGGPPTSTCSHNFFGVRFGVYEIALSAYPTLEICRKLGDQRARCGVHGMRDSNPCLGFELANGSTFLRLACRRPKSVDVQTSTSLSERQVGTVTCGTTAAVSVDTQNSLPS